MKRRWVGSRPRCTNEDEDDGASVTRRGTAIFFNAEVTKKSIRELSEALDEAVREAYETYNRIDQPRLSLFIHSSGGDLYAGLQAYDVICRCVLNVVTVAEGYVASAATLLHLAGKTRFVSPGCHFLIHQLRSSADGTHSEIRDEYKNNTKLMLRLRNIYLERTRLSEKRLDRLLHRELDLTADECVKRGIAEAVLGPAGVLPHVVVQGVEEGRSARLAALVDGEYDRCGGT